MGRGPRTENYTRCAVLAMIAGAGLRYKDVAAVLDVSHEQARRLYLRACERGFNPKERPLVFKEEYFRDLPKTGRPPRNGRKPTGPDSVTNGETPATEDALPAEDQDDEEMLSPEEEPNGNEERPVAEKEYGEQNRDLATNSSPKQMRTSLPESGKPS